MEASSSVMEHDIVPTHLAVKAMRDNGYKNAAYAVAELMDNSIQADATVVELLCSDKVELLDHRERRRLSKVAVLDNGSGMDVDVLRIALQFGNGSRLDASDHTGMGRFGMGLPSASISQARRVDVWSWQDGPENALHSYIDLDEIERESQRSIPFPDPMPIPLFWRKAGTNFGPTGTLVVWSEIDRCLWRTSRALITNSESLIGRMYRKWIGDERVSIRLASFVAEKPDQVVHEVTARPNDPLYLTTGTSTPEPYDAKPMFRPFPDPEDNEIRIKVRFRGEDHEVLVRLSIAGEEARSGDQAGSRTYGRHAANNVGVSVIRAGRELELDTNWAISSDTRERWWGVEVCFEPGLDELFGVSNNKQSARNFSEAAKVDLDALKREHGGSLSHAKKVLEEDEDPIAPLLDVVHRVRSNIVEMRKIIQVQTKGARKQRHDPDSIERKATDAVRQRQKEGHTGASDEDEKKPREEREQAVKEELVHLGHEEEAAQELAAQTLDSGLKYQMNTGSLDGGTFFSVQSRGGVLMVTLAREHPAYDLLIGATTPDDLPDNAEQLKKRLKAAQDGLEMMLFAWARYEDEQPTESRKQTQRIRFDWGRMAESFLEARDAQ